MKIKLTKNFCHLNLATMNYYNIVN